MKTRRNFTRIVTMMLVVLMLIGTAACGAKTPETTETTTSATDSVTTATAVEETEPAETDRAHTKDDLPEELNYGGRTVNILFSMSDGGSADQIDWAETVIGEIVNDAVYYRQIAAEDRLGVKFTIYRGDTSTSWADRLRDDVKSDTGSFDIVYGPQHKTNVLILENMYLNMADSAYINYNQLW